MNPVSELYKYDPAPRATDTKTVFAFGIVVGAFVPLLVLALGAN